LIFQRNVILLVLATIWIFSVVLGNKTENKKADLVPEPYSNVWWWRFGSLVSQSALLLFVAYMIISRRDELWVLITLIGLFIFTFFINPRILKHIVESKKN